MAQYLESIVKLANALDAVNGTGLSVVTLTLPPGDWAVDAEAWINIQSGTPSVSFLAAQLTLNPDALMLNDPAGDNSTNVLTLNQSPSAKSTAGWVLPMASNYNVSQQNVVANMLIRVDWTGTGNFKLYGMISARKADVPMYLPA
jgi:hypothetical protein